MLCNIIQILKLISKPKVININQIFNIKDAKCLMIDSTDIYLIR